MRKIGCHYNCRHNYFYTVIFLFVSFVFFSDLHFTESVPVHGLIKLRQFHTGTRYTAFYNAYCGTYVHISRLTLLSLRILRFLKFSEAVQVLVSSLADESSMVRESSTATLKVIAHL